MNIAQKCFRRNPSELPDAPTVFVVDSDASVREILEPLIRSAGWQPNMAASADEFLAGPRVPNPSCLLAELKPTGVTGLDLRGLIFERPELPIILIGRNLDVQAAVRVMKEGAFDVLMMPLVTNMLLMAIRNAIERSRAAINQMAHIKVLQERYASLSAREREVMGLVVSGHLNKQVGGELGICEITVKVHRRSIMRKMQARSLAELVNMVASLRRWTVAVASSLHLPPEALMEPNRFTPSSAVPAQSSH
jgi:FixJ family two-component response regulator